MKSLRQWILWGHFSIFAHKSPPWKTGATRFEWITSKKLQNLHETTEPMDFRRSFFHLYRQIITMENEGYTVWMNDKQKIQKFARKNWPNGFYEVLFPFIQTNHPLENWGPHSVNGLQAKNSENCTKTLRQWVLWSPFSIITHKNNPLGKRV